MYRCLRNDFERCAFRFGGVPEIFELCGKLTKIMIKISRNLMNKKQQGTFRKRYIAYPICFLPRIILF